MTALRPVRRTLLPRSLQDTYYKYSFHDQDRAPAFAYDDGVQWANVVSGMHASAQRAVRACPDARLKAQESDFVDRLLVNWRARGYGLLAPTAAEEYTKHDAAQAAALTPRLRTFGADLVARINAMPVDELSAIMARAPVKLDRGKGAPWFNPGKDTDVTVAFAAIANASGSLADMKSQLSDIAPTPLGLVQVSHPRIQAALPKPGPAWTVSHGRLAAGAPTILPKRRRIGGQPFVMNHLWAPVGDVIRYLLSHRDPATMTGTFEEAARRRTQFRYAFAVDLKSYDTTVSFETQLAVHEHIILPVLSALRRLGLITTRLATLLAECDLFTQSIPILLPPLSDVWGAMVVDAEGQTRSGENLTSAKGSIINFCRIREKFQQLVGREMDEVNDGAINFGDDTVILTNSADLETIWNAHPSMLGFNEEPAMDTAFLMRRLEPNTGYAYLGRMLIGCVNKEAKHEPSSTATAAAAIAVRFSLLHGSPLQSAFWPSLRAGSAHSPRLRSAVAVAEANSFTTGSALRFIRVIAQSYLPKANSEEVDDWIELLRAAASGSVATSDPTYAQAISRLITAIQTDANATGSSLPWHALQNLAGKMGVQTARSELRRRAYTATPAYGNRANSEDA